MGNTIRRQPITHSIPAAPNYKFLNITDFRGLNITDNPFTAQPNTASDCLNVYVDENNALSTRPRLEKRINFATNGYSVVNVYPLNDGYLVHRKKDNKYHMGIVKMNNLSKIIEVTNNAPIGASRLKVFQQNNIIYILSGNNIHTITEEDGVYTLTAIDAYIPTIYSGLPLGEYNVIDLKQNEEYNLLTDNYKETYFWDGLSEIKISNPELESIENKYFVDKYTNVINLLQHKVILTYNPDDAIFVSMDQSASLPQWNNDFPNIPAYYVYKYRGIDDVLDSDICYYKNENGEKIYIVLPYDQGNYKYAISGNGRVILLHDVSNNKTIVYINPADAPNDEEFKKLEFKYSESITSSSVIKLSYLGHYLYISDETNTRVKEIYRLIDGEQQYFESRSRFNGSGKYYVYFSKDEKTWVFVRREASLVTKIYIVENIEPTGTTSNVNLPDTYVEDSKLFVNDNSYGVISGNNFSLSDGSKTLLLFNLKGGNPTKQYLEDSSIDYFRFSEDNTM